MSTLHALASATCEDGDLPQRLQGHIPVDAPGCGHEEGQHASGDAIPIVPIDPQVRDGGNS